MINLISSKRSSSIRWEIPKRPRNIFLTDSYGRTFSASSYEYNVALALWKFQLTFYFQFPLAGGRRVAGGMVLDFYVETRPLPTPILVNGDFWHRNPAKEALYTAMVENYFQGKARPVVTFWGEDASTPEAAVRSMRKFRIV